MPLLARVIEICCQNQGARKGEGYGGIASSESDRPVAQCFIVVFDQHFVLVLAWGNDRAASQHLAWSGCCFDHFGS